MLQHRRRPHSAAGSKLFAMARSFLLAVFIQCAFFDRLLPGHDTVIRHEMVSASPSYEPSDRQVYTYNPDRAQSSQHGKLHCQSPRWIDRQRLSGEETAFGYSLQRTVITSSSGFLKLAQPVRTACGSGRVCRLWIVDCGLKNACLIRNPKSAFRNPASRPLPQAVRTAATSSGPSLHAIGLQSVLRNASVPMLWASI